MRLSLTCKRQENKNLLLASICAFSILAASQAYAADLEPLQEDTPEPTPEANDPLIEGSFLFELQNDYIFSSEDGDEFNDTFNTTEVAVDVRFTDFFFVHSDLTFEPVDNPDPITGVLRGDVRTPGENIFFEDHALFFETLHLQAEYQNFAVYGGKINPAFGTAWDVTPGTYGVDLAEEYEIVERIGFGASYTFSTETHGEHTFNAAGFFLDTSGLSRSFGTNRGRTALEDGGASNTESIESVALALDGSEIAALPGFAYHLGFRFQSEGEDGPPDENVGDETGFAVGAIQELGLADDLALTLNAEIAYFNNFNGGPTDDFFGTIGGILEYGKWFGTAAFTARNISTNVGDPDFTDLQFQAGVGKELFENATLEVGYRFLREEDNDTHTIGTFFVYETDFRILRP